MCVAGREHPVCVHRASEQGHQHAVLLAGGPRVRSLQAVSFNSHIKLLLVLPASSLRRLGWVTQVGVAVFNDDMSRV